MSTVTDCPKCGDTGYVAGEDWDGCETVTRCDCRPPLLDAVGEWLSEQIERDKYLGIPWVTPVVFPIGDDDNR